MANPKQWIPQSPECESKTRPDRGEGWSAGIVDVIACNQEIDTPTIRLTITTTANKIQNIRSFFPNSEITLPHSGQ